jgi:NAD(P)-dependent dehydrogenase (short-subunit alcohol dehydrogenase family)
VVGTLRQPDQLAEFEALAPGRAIGRILDVTDTAAIKVFVQNIEAEFGAIDVLLNNAGYGLRGVLEELDLDDLRRQFEVNVFAPVALIQAALPAMRKRRSGLIINMVSMGAIYTFPALSAYHGSKFALLGMNDGLAKEVNPLGVKVMAILPGVFRSDWGTRSLAEAEHRIRDYDAALVMPQNEWGDPAALGRVVLDAIELDEPPAHLLVGPTALKNVRERVGEWTAEIDRWEELSFAGGEG